MITRLRRWGNSQGICITKDILTSLDWTNGESVEVVADPDQERIIIKKCVPKRRRKNIKQLFDGFEGTYPEEEIDWGKPEGKEVWSFRR